MTPERLEEIKACCEKATPGPWTTDYDNRGMGTVTQIVAGNQGIIGPRVQVWHNGTITLFLGDDDADVPNEELDFVCMARTAIPELLEEVERLQMINEGLLRRIDNSYTALDTGQP